MSDLIERAAAQTELMMKCERYTLARESHGMGHVEWSSDLISVADAMDAIRDLPSAQPEPLVKKSRTLVNDLVKDTVSRQAAIATVKNVRKVCDTNDINDYHDLLLAAFDVLPSAQPLVIHCTDCEDWHERQSIMGFAISELPPAQPYVPDTNVGSMISRQAAIDALNRCTDVYHTNLPPLVDKEEVRRALTSLPSAQPEPQWIPCSERLPEVGKDVMVCYDFKGHRSVLIGVLYGDEKFHGYDDEYLTPEGRKYRKAVAWMPLPEPYRAEIRGDENVHP